MPRLPSKIISGGQTGADRAGLDFAIAHGIEHGGWCPAGRRSEDGPIPSIYALIPTPEWGYAKRTELNVRDADVTLIFNRPGQLSPGTALTVRLCERIGRPFLILRLPPQRDAASLEATSNQIAEFLATHEPQVVNVAGNRENTAPGMSAFVQSALAAAWPKIATAEVTMPRCVQAALFDLDERAPARRSGR